MSAANTIPAIALLGGGILALGSTVLQTILPSPAPVEITRLEYANGMVTQSSFFRTDGETGQVLWSTQLVNSETGEPVPGCEGNGHRLVESGPRDTTKPLDQWIGSLSCIASILPSGTYYLRTVLSSNWTVGEATYRSEPFEVRR